MRILEFRLKNNLSQKELAEKIGVSPGYVNKIEHHKKIPSIDILIHLIYALNAGPCEILEIDCIGCKKCKNK